MANLSIYDPFSTRLNRFFNHFGLSNPSIFDDDDALKTMNLKIDVSEDDKNYLVHADLPGVKKEDIRVNVDGNQVSINAEVRNKKEEKMGKNVIHSERYEGKVFRSFTLDCAVDESKSVAKFTDGVLELTLPKQTGGNTSRQIAVQ